MKRNPIRPVLSAALAALLVFGTGCGKGASGSSDGDGKDPGGRTELVVATQTSAVNQAILEASGAFDDLDYDIEWAYFDGANSTVEALNAGRVDLTYALASTSLVLAQGNAQPAWTNDTAPFKAVGAQISNEFSGSNIVVAKDSGIESITDLAGKRIGLAKGSFHHFFAVAALEEAGLTTDDVEIVTMPVAEARPAYRSGALDALVTGVTSAHPFIVDGHSVVLTDSEDVLPFYSLIVAHRDALADPARVEAIDDFLERLEAVERWKLDHPDAVVDLFESVEKRDRADAEFSAERSPSTLVPVDEDFVVTQARQAELFREGGIISLDIDPSIAVDDRFNR